MKKMPGSKSIHFIRQLFLVLNALMIERAVSTIIRLLGRIAGAGSFIQGTGII
ncbi:hypothetical protein SAMN02982927_01335 [Sporolactobacillus nakayamae]|uniref:Uncharacterized protein n=1 Tax=Sporolactobacillus nakayamae TaxID=269670 RepID=A0A1I2R1S7_9BACL|nr:hypothetical protein SAMN02982927_01335 [Sporolactobacillus nakayamae]